jgi:hypothetical protein
VVSTTVWVRSPPAALMKQREHIPMWISHNDIITMGFEGADSVIGYYRVNLVPTEGFNFYVTFDILKPRCRYFTKAGFLIDKKISTIILPKDPNDQIDMDTGCMAHAFKGESQIIVTKVGRVGQGLFRFVPAIGR